VTIQPGPFQQNNSFQETSPFGQPSFNSPSPAVKQSLNLNVGEVNPALFAAGARMNLTREERNLIETWSSIKGTHEKLMAMDNKKAVKEFNKLNPEDQQTLTSYYKIDYANKANENSIIENPKLRKLIGIDNGFSPGDAFKSFFRFAMAGAEQYERAFNAPYTQALEKVTNREDFWSRSNFEMSFDGEFSYDEKLKEQLVSKYGEELSFTAMHLLAGRTPGEIIDAYGPNSAEILEAVNQVFNEPEKIAGIMDEFDRARLSPGRGVARWVNKTFDISAEEHPDWFKVGSGSIDLAFQIFADPMTWLSAGRSVLFKAERLTKALVSTRDTVAYFANPGVARYFEGYATKIGEYRAAQNAGNSNEAAKILENIQSKYSRHGTDEEVNLWAKTFKVDNFDDFKNLFLGEGAHEISRLFQGRVVGTAFSSSSAVYAKRSRNVTFKAKEKVKEIFRGKAAFDQLDEAGTAKFLNELSKIDDVNYSDIEKTIQDVNGKGVKKLLKQLEYQFSLHPGSKAVFFNERYIETIETVRQQANLVFKNKALAHLYTEHFKTATMTERKFLKKNLDILTYRSAGVHGLPKGKEFIESRINNRYGDDNLFGTQLEVVHPPQFGTELQDTRILGPIESGDFKEAFGPIDFKEVSQFVAASQLRADKKLDARTIANLFGGAYNSKFLSDFIDWWSLGTLFPQLGVRSATDEGFFLALTQNPAFVKEFKKAQKYGKAFSVSAGSSKSTGPIKDTIHAALGKITGKRIGPVRTISDKERDAINAEIDEDFAKGVYANFNEAEEARKLAFIRIGTAKYLDGNDEKTARYLEDLALHKPQFLSDISSLKVFDATMNRQSLRTPERLITKENSDKSLEEASLASSGVYRVEYLKGLAEEPLEAIMYDSFYKALNQRPYEIGVGNKNPNLDAPRLFLKHNGLKTTQDVDNAVFDFLTAVGFRYNDNAWSLSNNHVGDVQRFINSSSHFLKFADLPDVKKVEGLIRDAFSSIYVAFHGDINQYNHHLMRLFRPFVKGKVPDHRLILKDISRTDDVYYPPFNPLNPNEIPKIKIPSYRKLTKDFKPKQYIITDLEDTLLGYAGNVRKFGDRVWEGMARQNDDIVRSPAVTAHYVLSRSQMEVDEIAYAKRIAERSIDEGMEPSKAFNHGARVAAEFFSNRAITEATNRVLKFIDNPDIRTVFAYNVRTIGRFYRAVEDFQRRVYRLVQGNKLNTIIRLRLFSQGMDANGDVHEDANGERYLIVPMDDIIYGAVDGALRMLTDDKVSVRQPLFNDITFNVTAGNPSFQTDAGVPYLSGPAASMSILAVKNLLGNFATGTAANTVEDLDQWTLGTMGDNVTVRNSIVPKFVNNIWKMLSPDERDQQEVSAYMQALAYNQANDFGINPEDYYNEQTGVTDQAKFDEDRRKYLDDTRIAAHNIIVTRALLGMILPFAVQTKDTKDLPTYLKDVGIVSMKTSFYEVFDEVKLKYPDVENHYELALATWMGKNPGKIAYLVDADQEAVKPLIKYSNEMQNWAISNAKDIEKYGNGALMFAPNTGEFSPGVYKWAEASGLTNKIPENESARGYIEKYYQDLMFREYVNGYYDIQDKEEEDLRNIPFESASLRRASIQAYQDIRDQYKIGVPGLEEYIGSGKDITDSSDFIQSAYNYVNSPNANVKPEVKKSINEAYAIFNEFIEYVNLINSYDPEGGADMKRAKKIEAQEKIKKLIAADLSKTVEQYYKYGLLKVMNKKSRDARPGISTNVIEKVRG